MNRKQRRALAHPLTAIILVHLQNSRAGSGGAASLNFPELVEDFWRRRRATLDPALTSGLDLVDRRSRGELVSLPPAQSSNGSM